MRISLSRSFYRATPFYHFIAQLLFGYMLISRVIIHLANMPNYNYAIKINAAYLISPHSGGLRGA